MDFSASELLLLEKLGRKLATGPAIETLVADVHGALKEIAGVSEVRLVVSEPPAGWKEWAAGARSTGARTFRNFGPPVPGGTTVYFDQDNIETGFLWIPSSESKAEQVLKLIAPQIATATMLSAALGRSRRSSIHERELVRQALRSRDEERRRIARELHDDLGQSLASLKLNLKWAENVVRSGERAEEAAAELVAAREAVGAILGKVRDLSHTLYPNILDTLGFGPAVRELVYQTTRRSGMEVECRAPDDKGKLPREVAVSLYRCCQEALSNAVRHSAASKLVVDVNYGEEEVRLTVEDNGRGFDPGALGRGGTPLATSGFWTIRQRVGDLGGAFRVSTAEGAGSVIEIIIPTNLRTFDVRRKDKAANRR